jgi:adenylylsulfate kinase-like enzyme
MIIWFTGISGVGKTLIAKKLFKILKKKIKNIVHIDGDKFRSILNNDIGYSLKDRDINASRIINFVQLLNDQKINVIVSANLTSQKYRRYCKKKFNKYLEINISTDLDLLKKRDKKKIYTYRSLKNVVGFGIKNIKNNTANIKILNNDSKKKFLRNILILKKTIEKKLI